MTGENVADYVGAGERLMDLHRRAAGVGEDVRDALALQRLHEDVAAFPWCVGGKAGNERLLLHDLLLGRREYIRDLERAAAGDGRRRDGLLAVVREWQSEP